MLESIFKFIKPDKPKQHTVLYKADVKEIVVHYLGPKLGELGFKFKWYRGGELLYKRKEKDGFTLLWIAIDLKVNKKW